MEPDILTTLRAHTRPLQAALESRYPFCHFLQDRPLEVGVYADVLIVLYQFHAMSRHWLSGPRVTTPFALSTDNVLAALDADLNALGIQADTLLCPAPLAVVGSDSACAIGAQYVWLGSSLGAIRICQWLKHTAPTLPHQYYTLMKTQSRGWSRFTATLGSRCQQAGVSDTAVASAASALFDALLHLAAERDVTGQVTVKSIANI
ncbi:biliverdin-producing heme oxygenase [Alteromonas sp. CYL-A6]|uniref:biliverdin-producing heme oxygenase n=1 Tax=Alteromonas nitratireducens TaxID=3390813 RepID=UPI0034B69086